MAWSSESGDWTPQRPCQSDTGSGRWLVRVEKRRISTTGASTFTCPRHRLYWREHGTTRDGSRFRRCSGGSQWLCTVLMNKTCLGKTNYDWQKTSLVRLFPLPRNWMLVSCRCILLCIEAMWLIKTLLFLQHVDDHSIGMADQTVIKKGWFQGFNFIAV